jgi:hypothetical protein
MHGGGARCCQTVCPRVPVVVNLMSDGGSTGLMGLVWYFGRAGLCLVLLLCHFNEWGSNLFISYS